MATRKMSITRIKGPRNFRYTVRNPEGQYYPGVVATMDATQLVHVASQLGLSFEQLGIMCAILGGDDPERVAKKHPELVEFDEA